MSTTEDVSPPNFSERNSGYYERSSRLVADSNSSSSTNNNNNNSSSSNNNSSNSESYSSRRSNQSASAHSNEIRRTRDRIYRNGAYTTAVSLGDSRNSGESNSLSSSHNSSNQQSRVPPSWYEATTATGTKSTTITTNGPGGNGSAGVSAAGNANYSTSSNNLDFYSPASQQQTQPSAQRQSSSSSATGDTSSNSKYNKLLKSTLVASNAERCGSESPSAVGMAPHSSCSTISSSNNNLSSSSNSVAANNGSSGILNAAAALATGASSSSNSSSEPGHASNNNITTTSSSSASNAAQHASRTHQLHGRSTTSSSRSHSRSPSSYSSSHSCSSSSNSSSHSHASSPISGGHDAVSATSSSAAARLSRSSLQSAVITPQAGSASEKPSNCGSSSSSSSSSSSLMSANPVVHSEDNRPLAIRVRNLPARSSDTSLKDGLFHEYKKHGKVTWVKVVGLNSERYGLVCFKKPEDVEKALEVSHDKLFFGCKIEVEPYQGYDVEDNEFRPYEAELDEYHPKSTRTLFIGNLEKEISASELRSHFDSFGEIIEIDIKKQGMNAYAFCQYSDIVSVVKAMRKMDGEHLGNNRIKLGFGKSMPTNCVWIDGVGEKISESHLQSQFSRYGAVTKVIVDRMRQLALVLYDQIQYAQTAVKEMRGATLRGRKLQVDFASRECQDAFYDKLEKPATGSRFSRYDSQTRSRASSFSRHQNSNDGCSPSNTPGSCTSSSGSVVNAPTLSSAIVTGGATTATLVGSSSVVSTTPTSAAVQANSAGNTTPARSSRGSRSSRHTMDYDYMDTRRFRSYDEYSQGSGASHDEDNAGHGGLRSDSPLLASRLGPIVNNTASAMVVDGPEAAAAARRRCDKSPAKQKGDMRVLQKERSHLLEQLGECPSSDDDSIVSPRKRIKIDHHHSTNASSVGLTQSHSLDSDVHLKNQTNSNCDATSLHDAQRKGEVRRLSECNNLKYPPPHLPHHMQHQHHLSRRPSIDIAAPTNAIAVSGTASIRHGNGSGSGLQVDQHHHQNPHMGSSNSASMACKRRRVIPGSSGSALSTSVLLGASGGLLSSSASNSTGEEFHHHTSRGRGHQLHSHHSHEASGGESADGSRPGTPLCDERPEVLPSEPRRLPRERPHEPMMLPLPKFGIQFFQQYRNSVAGAVAAAAAGHHHSSYTSSSSTAGGSSGLQNSHNHSHSSLSHSSVNASLTTHLLSPSTRYAPHWRAHNHHHHHHHHHQQQPHHYHGPHNQTASSNIGGPHSMVSPLRPRSLSSNSSDSDAPGHSSGSPSLEERIKTLDEMYERWSGGSSSLAAGATVVKRHDFNHSHAPTWQLHRSTSSGSSTDHFSNPTHASTAANNTGNSSSAASTPTTPSASSSRHKFLDLDVKEMQPSEIVKSVLAKKSIFDDDLQRLKKNQWYDPQSDAAQQAKNMVGVCPSPGLPNLAATKTPVVGCSMTKPAGLPQRLSSLSPMNSPQASMSPYNSPSPSPSVSGNLAAPVAKLPSLMNVSNSATSLNVGNTSATSIAAVGTPTTKGLQYPFPSHPPLPNTAAPAPVAQPAPPAGPAPADKITSSTPPLPPPPTAASEVATESNNPANSNRAKTNAITKSLSVPATQTASTAETRTLSKSISVPGSTNSGTVIPNEPTAAQTTNSSSSNSSSSHNKPEKEEKSSSKTCNKTKTDKAHKQLHRSESDKKSSHSKTERSSDKRKNSVRIEEEISEAEDEKDKAAELERQESEKLQKEREKREKELRKQQHEKEQQEKEERQQKEKERLEREKIEKEFRLQKEKEDREKAERLQKEKERQEREQREKKEKEEQQRKEREEREACERRAKEEQEKLQHELQPRKKSAEANSKSAEASSSLPNHVGNEFIQHSSEERLHNKENASEEILHSSSVEGSKHHGRKSSRNSPVRHPKRRLSSQDSNQGSSSINLNTNEEHTKRIRMEAQLPVNNSSSERRDSKDAQRTGKQHHHRQHSSSSHKSHSMEQHSTNTESKNTKDHSSNKHRSKHHNKHHTSTHAQVVEHEAPVLQDEKVSSEKTTIQPAESIEEKHNHHNHHEQQELIKHNSSGDDEDVQQKSTQSHKHREHSGNHSRHKSKREHREKKRHSTTDASSIPPSNVNCNFTDEEMSSQNAYRRSSTGEQGANKPKPELSHLSRSTERKFSRCSDEGLSTTPTTTGRHKNTPSRKMALSSADSDDSEDTAAAKKHSIFDIPAEGPYVSMYDKVKARSCKNMQKQEEEKKIKAKFSQLKQCRAKREEKKRSGSYEGDSDSEFEDRNQRSGGSSSYKSRNHLSSSDEDGDDGDEIMAVDRRRVSQTSSHPQRMFSDSDSQAADAEALQRNKMHQNLMRLCDGDDSSDEEIRRVNVRKVFSPSKRITSKRNSHSTRIASDSESQSTTDVKPIKTETKIYENDASDKKFNREIKQEHHYQDSDAETKYKQRCSSISSVDMDQRIKTEPLDVLSSEEIKKECNDCFGKALAEGETYEFSREKLKCQQAIVQMSQESSQYFSPESRKKHKKSKKRQKTPSVPNDVAAHNFEEIKPAVTNTPYAYEMSNSTMKSSTPDLPPKSAEMNSSFDLFDELKREAGNSSVINNGAICDLGSLSGGDKKRHKERKEKKREKLRNMSSSDMRTSAVEVLSKEERHRLKKSKKSKSLEGMRGSFNSLSQTAAEIVNATPNNIHKRAGEKMEDIFGPISDEESQFTDNETKELASAANSNTNTTPTNLTGPIASAALNPYKHEPLTPKSHTVEENEENKLKIASVLPTIERERHRKEKREKKRKEREKSREQHALSSLQTQIKPLEDDNSVDLDEAGRALEAQLMEDSDNKMAEDATPSTATTYRSDMTDVFRFSDGDENSMDNITATKDTTLSDVNANESQCNQQQLNNKTKEKKKKKKRSKEDRHHHQRRESSSSTASQANTIQQPQTQTPVVASTKLTVDIQTAGRHSQKLERQAAVKLEDDEVNEASTKMCKPSPSLPCLMGDDDEVEVRTKPELPPPAVAPVVTTGSTSALNTSAEMMSLSPIREQKQMISPIPKTPTITNAANSSNNNSNTATTPTSSTAAVAALSKSAESSASSNSSQCSAGHLKKKPEIFIPGFDGELDDKISEAAVKSLSAEFNSAVQDVATDEPKIPVESPPDTSKHLDKHEEATKSRVTISQEETESAVSALLGESFGNSSNADYSFNDEDDLSAVDTTANIPTEVDEEAALAAQALEATTAAMQPEEDAEEISKAVQSLSNEEMDIKADTPQSERDLQIDTDTEENIDEADSSGNSLKIDENPPNSPATTVLERKKEELVGKSSKQPQESKVIKAVTPVPSSVITKIDREVKATTAAITELKKSSKVNEGKTEVQPVHSVLPSMINLDAPAASSSTTATSSHSVSFVSTPVKNSSGSITAASTPKQATSVPIQRSMPLTQQLYTMQPPTITIPDHTHFAMPQMVLSPRGNVSTDHLILSPHGQMPPQSPVGAYVSVRAPSPHSPQLQVSSRGGTPTRQLSPGTPSTSPTVILPQHHHLLPGSSASSQQMRNVQQQQQQLLMSAGAANTQNVNLLSPVQQRAAQANTQMQQSQMNSPEIQTAINKMNSMISSSTVVQVRNQATASSPVGSQPKSVIEQHQSSNLGQHVLPITVHKMPPVPTHPTIISKVVTVQPQQAQQSLAAGNSSVSVTQKSSYSPTTTQPPQSPQQPQRTSTQISQQISKISAHQQHQQQQYMQQQHVLQQQRQQQQQQHHQQMQQQIMQQQQKQIMQQHLQQKMQHQMPLPPGNQQQQTTPKQVYHMTTQQLNQAAAVGQQQRSLPSAAPSSPKTVANQTTSSQPPQNLVILRPNQPQQQPAASQSPAAHHNVIQGPQTAQIIVQQQIIGMSPPAQQQQLHQQHVVMPSKSTQQQPSTPVVLQQQSPQYTRSSASNASSPPTTSSSSFFAKALQPQEQKKECLENKNMPTEAVSVIRTPGPSIIITNKESCEDNSLSKPVTGKDELVEHDSKEDSDYWSAKEVDSVIKKLDKAEEQVPLKTVIEEKPIEKTTAIVELNTSSNLNAANLSAASTTDHDTEDETETQHLKPQLPPSNMGRANTRGGAASKRGRQPRGGKKMTGGIPLTPVAASTVPTPVIPPQAEASGVQTRLRKPSTASNITRGRKGRPPRNLVAQQQQQQLLQQQMQQQQQLPIKSQTAATSSLPVLTPGEKKARSQALADSNANAAPNMTGEDDVYEFHDDSGSEEATSSSKQTNNPHDSDDNRPRIILTIKGPPNSKDATNVGEPSKTEMPSESKELEEHEAQQSELENAAANTRKSRRLQEKDRSTIDDIIEDVVRNTQTNAALLAAAAMAASAAGSSGLPLPKGAQTPPRRSGRNSNPKKNELPVSAQANITHARPPKRSKDRKASADNVAHHSDAEETVKGTTQEEEEYQAPAPAASVTNVPQPIAIPATTQQTVLPTTPTPLIINNHHSVPQHPKKKALAAAESESYAAMNAASPISAIPSSAQPIIHTPAAPATQKTTGGTAADAANKSLLDPVSGLITGMQQGKEGNLPSATAAANSSAVPLPSHKPTIMDPKKMMQAAAAAAAASENIPTSGSSKIGIATPITALSKSMPTEGTTAGLTTPEVLLNKPVSVVVKTSTVVIQQQIVPPPAGTSTQQQQSTPQITTPSKQPIVVHQSPVAMHGQHSNVGRATSLKAHVLNSQKIQRQVPNAPLQQQAQHVVVSSPNQIIQNVQRHSGQASSVPQQLLVNIPPVHSPQNLQQGSLNSPRNMSSQQPQQTVLIKQGQMPPTQHQLPSNPQVLHVVSSKATVQPAAHHQTAPQTQSLSMHASNKPQPPHGYNTATVLQQQTAPPHHLGKHLIPGNVGVSVLSQPQQQQQQPVGNKPHAAALQQQAPVSVSTISHHKLPAQTINLPPGMLNMSHLLPSKAPPVHLQQPHQQMTPSPPLVHTLQTQNMQLLSGAVGSSPPPTSAHKPTSVSQLRTAIPNISPQGQARVGPLLLPSGMPVPPFEANMGESSFAAGALRGVPTREHFMMYSQFYEDKLLGSSPPLELRRPSSVPRTIVVPHSMQSPQDRATDSPQITPVYMHNSRMPTHYTDVAGRNFYDNSRNQMPIEPPPAHRSATAHSVVAPPVVVPPPGAGSGSPFMGATGVQPPPPPNQSTPPNMTNATAVAHMQYPKQLQDREREQREQQLQREKERFASMAGSHENLGRSLQVASPSSHVNQVVPSPPQADSLLTLLQRYPVMWQGLLALKTDQAAVQMHFVFGNQDVARASLPCNSDGSTPPLRIAQRMRLEQTQLEGVAKKMQFENEHCMLLALPCGRDHADVLQQSRNLQTGFITYLQQKMAAGIVNIPMPGSEQAAYVVHIFPSCDFANENLERAAPDLKNRVAEIAHLLIVIATV